jgi:hypothetical protein
MKHCWLPLGIAVGFLVGFPVALAPFALLVMRVGLVAAVLTIFGALGAVYRLGLFREACVTGGRCNASATLGSTTREVIAPRAAIAPQRWVVPRLGTRRRRSGA